MVSVNATFFVQLFLFLLLVLILNTILFKPIMGIARQREERLKKTKEEILDIQKKVQSLLAQQKEQEALAIREANQKREDLKRAAIKEAEKRHEILKEELKSKRKITEAELEKVIQNEMLKLEQNAKLLAKDLLAKITNKRGMVHHA